MSASAEGLSNRVQAAIICRRFFLDGRSKVEIAKEFGISRFRVARILDDARASGLVTIEIAMPPGVDIELSEQLRAAYDLRRAIVVDLPVDSEEALRHQLGHAAADLVTELVTEDDVLGIGWGRTLDHMTQQLTTLAACPVVQMTGVVGSLNENSLELVRRVGMVTGGPTFPLYAPLMVSDPQTAASLRAQATVAAVLRRFSDISIAVVAIGSWDPPNSQLRNALPPDEQAELRRRGVRGEICSTLLDDNGNTIAEEFSDRAIAITARQLRHVPEVIGVAGGLDKAAAIQAVLRGGYLNSLITDRSAAQILLDSDQTTVLTHTTESGRVDR